MKTNKIKIGHQVYTLVPNDENLMDMGLLGVCYKNKSRIEYTANVPPDILADTVIHETLHAIVDNYLFDAAQAGEEEIVTQLAHGIVQVMRDNPKFFAELRALL